MNTADLLRLLCAVMIGGALIWAFHKKTDGETGDDRRFAPIIWPFALPFFLLCVFVLYLAVYGTESLPLLGVICLEVFLQMSVYFALLILLLPLLRRFISARACGLLWLLPNMLYLTQMFYMRAAEPRFILQLRGGWLRYALLIWAAGAALFLLWKCLEHLRFRRTVKRSARPEEDPALLEAWSGMQERSLLKKARIPLLRSALLRSPLSVGLFFRTTFVVLPEKSYSEEESRLILQHELVHITRRDSQTKFFLMLCTAFCWFDPLMWTAIRRCAEDLELSCDELVLDSANVAEKRLYADLILGSAGESRGFTSCLSATANSLRYRLKQIMTPAKKLPGGVLAGLMMVLLLMSGGLVAFAFDGGTAGEKVFHNDLPVLEKNYHVTLGHKAGPGHAGSDYENFVSFVCEDPGLLLEYLAGLKVSSINGSTDPREGNIMDMFLPGEGGPTILTLEERYLSLTEYRKGLSRGKLWHLEEEVDWNYIRSLLKEMPSAPPEPPELFADFGPEEAWGSVGARERFSARPLLLENTLDGEASPYYTAREPLDFSVVDIPFAYADLSFNYDFPPEELSVTLRDKAGNKLQDVPVENNGRIRLPGSGRYVVEARWEFGTDAGMQVYGLEYSFNVELPK